MTTRLASRGDKRSEQDSCAKCNQTDEAQERIHQCTLGPTREEENGWSQAPCTPAEGRIRGRDGPIMKVWMALLCEAGDIEPRLIRLPSITELGARILAGRGRQILGMAQPSCLQPNTHIPACMSGVQLCHCMDSIVPLHPIHAMTRPRAMEICWLKRSMARIQLSQLFRHNQAWMVFSVQRPSLVADQVGSTREHALGWNTGC